MNQFSNVLHLKSVNVEMPINYRHVILFSLASYFSYDTYMAYNSYLDVKEFVIRDKVKAIAASKLNREHQEAIQAPISIDGYPDTGNWLISDFLDDAQWLLVNEKKSRFEELYRICSNILPLLILAGSQYPLIATAMGMGYLYTDKMLNMGKGEINRMKYREVQGYIGYGLGVYGMAAGLTTGAKILQMLGKL